MTMIKFVLLFYLIYFSAKIAESYGRSRNCLSLLQGRWFEHKWLPYTFIPAEGVLGKTNKVFTLSEPGLIRVQVTGRIPATGGCGTAEAFLREVELPCCNRCQFKIVNFINEQGDTIISDIGVVRTRFRDVIIMYGCAVRDNRTAKCTRPDAWVLMRHEFLTSQQIREVDRVLRRLGLGPYLDNGEFVLTSTGPSCRPN